MENLNKLAQGEIETINARLAEIDKQQELYRLEVERLKDVADGFEKLAIDAQLHNDAFGMAVKEFRNILASDTTDVLKLDRIKIIVTGLKL